MASADEKPKSDNPNLQFPLALKAAAQVLVAWLIERGKEQKVTEEEESELVSNEQDGEADRP